MSFNSIYPTPQELLSCSNPYQTTSSGTSNPEGLYSAPQSSSRSSYSDSSGPISNGPVQSCDSIESMSAASVTAEVPTKKTAPKSSAYCPDCVVEAISFFVQLMQLFVKAK